ncbi:MAG: NADH-quinone oxidoreductase subunit B [Planctomycetota bacterium]|jgi:NADH-quinone oxidoreductase subunit B
MGLETALGENVLTTTLAKLVNWARSFSFWPYPFGTACCAIEYMAVVGVHYDISRFGAEAVRFSPRQADMMIVAGTITYKQAPILRMIYDQMCEPKWVLCMGACACSGGFYNAYHVVQGCDQIIPVDIYIPGCPPRPETLLQAVTMLQKKVRSQTFMDLREEKKKIYDMATGEYVDQPEVDGDYEFLRFTKGL